MPNLDRDPSILNPSVEAFLMPGPFVRQRQLIATPESGSSSSCTIS